MIKEVVINPRRKVRCDLDSRSIIKAGQDSSMLSKIYDVNGPNQKDASKFNRGSNSPYLPRYKKSHRSLSLKDKRVVYPEANNRSQVLMIQEKIFADLHNFENSLQLESGRSSQASVIQKSLDEKSFSAGVKKFDNLPFARDLDLFRQKFKKMFPNQTEQSPAKRDQGQEYKLKHGKVSLQIKQRAQSIYTHNNVKANLILKQFQSATKQSQDQLHTTTSKRSVLNKSHSGAHKRTRKDLNQSFGPVYHHHQKPLHDRNQSFDIPSKNIKTDMSMDDGEHHKKHRLLKLQQEIPAINLNRLKNIKANYPHSSSNNSKERIAKSLKQKHSDLELAPMIFSSLEKEDHFKVIKKHNRSLVMNEEESRKLKNPKFEYNDLVNQILAANERPKPPEKSLDSDVLKQDNRRKQWMVAFEEKKARLMNIYINGRQDKTPEKLQTEPDPHYKTIDPNFYSASKNPSSSVFEINQQHSDFQSLPLGTSTSWIKNLPAEIQKKHSFLGKSIPKRKTIPK